MEDKAGRSVHQEEVPGSPRKTGGLVNRLYPADSSGKGRLRNHCRRFWWCDLLVIVIIILVVVLPIIFVGIPNKAQHEINASTLEVRSQEVTNPMSNSVHLKLDSVIKSSSSYHPTVDGFRAGLSLEGQQPFIYINIPEAKSEAETPVTVEQDVTFDSKDRFTDYTKAVLASETFKVYLSGKTKVHLSGLPAMKVNYNQVVTMKGLNRLSGLNITSLRILSGASQLLPDGSNMLANVSIPNPSVMTLDLGNVTMNLAVDAKPIGYGLLPNLVLKPGNNSLTMQAHVDQLSVIGLITGKYKNAVLPLEVVGNSSVSNGEHLTYYEEAIGSNTIKLDLNVGPALAVIGLNLTNVGSGA